MHPIELGQLALCGEKVEEFDYDIAEWAAWFVEFANLGTFLQHNSNVIDFILLMEMLEVEPEIKLNFGCDVYIWRCFGDKNYLITWETGDGFQVVPTAEFDDWYYSMPDYFTWSDEEGDLVEC